MQIFNSPELQEKYEKDGYIIIDFLSEDQIRKYLEFWEKSPKSYANGIFTSVFGWNEEENLSFSKLIAEHFQPAVNQLMTKWEVDGATFMVKGPSAEPQTEFKLHQDYNMLDESISPSLGLWVALVDINEKNGGLFVLPGSHRKFAGTIRGANITSLFLTVDHQIEKIIKHISLKAGQACIFSHSLFHGSYPNYTSDERIVIHAGLFPQNAKTYHYYKTLSQNGAEQVEVLEIERKDYYKNIRSFLENPKSVPHKVAGILNDYKKTPTPEDILEAYKNELPVIQHSTPGKTSWLKKLFSSK